MSQSQVDKDREAVLEAKKANGTITPQEQTELTKLQAEAK
jgi:hypothetical protein